MSKDNRKKGPPPPLPNKVAQKPGEKAAENAIEKAGSIPSYEKSKDSPASAQDDDLKGEFQESKDDASSTATLGDMNSPDKTSIIAISEVTNTVNRLPARIVPVIQVSAGAEQGRIVSLAQYKNIIIGREKECELRVFDPSCSRKHAEVYVADNGKVFLKDLGSTNGTKINGKKLAKDGLEEIKDGDRIQLGDSTVIRYTLMPEQDARVHMDVYFRATRDRLTNAFNRHHFDEALDREVSYQRRSGHGLGIILFDVDHFKRVNDTFGHPGGDEVLREIGVRVNTVIRNEDIFARVGGEEFGIIIRNDTLEGTKILTERLRQVMEKKPVDFEGRQIWFTISIGVNLLTKASTQSSTAILQVADDALYEAKNAGRNRVVIKNT